MRFTRAIVRISPNKRWYKKSIGRLLLVAFVFGILGLIASLIENDAAIVLWSVGGIALVVALRLLPNI